MLPILTEIVSNWVLSGITVALLLYSGLQLAKFCEYLFDFFNNKK